MANIIKPKRSNTAAKVPTTTELISGELGVNMADRKVYINNGTAVVQVGAGNLSGLGDVAIATPANGQALTYNSTTSKWQNSSAGTGTVTSVGITPGTGVTVSGSPVTTSGNIAVGLSTKLTAIENLSGAGFITQNGTGVIAGRTLQAGTGISIAHGNGSSQDPVITNSAPDQTVALTGAGATSISGTYPNFTITSVNTTYSTATSTVPGLIELASDTAQTVAANAVTATASRTYGLQLNAAGQGVVNVPWTDTVYSLPAATSTVRGGIELGSDTAQTVASNAVTATASRSYALQVNADGQGVVNVPWTDTNSGGTVTSVAVSGGTTGLTTSGGPITTSGTITLAGTLAVANGGTGATTAAAARTNLGATTLGGNLYTLANVAAIAFPRFNADNTVSSLDAASFRTAIGAGTSSTTGTVTSVGGTGTVSGLTLTGTVTTSGNLTLGGTLAVTPSNFSSQTAKTFLAAPNAAAGVPTFRAIVASDIPTLNQSTTGSAATLTTGRTIAMTGDVSYTSGSFNGGANVTGTATLANSGVTAGTYTKVTVNAKGLTTSGTTLAASDIPELTMAKLPGAAYKQSVRCATTANLTATATTTTLTNSSTLAALVLDEITVATNDRVLVKNQTTAAQNGIYTVTNVGSASVAWVLTRTADADAADEIGAAVVNVDTGTANGGELWTTTFKTTDTLGTTAMNWYEVLYNTGSWGISITGSSASTTGNAATATALQTARTIGGVSFNGTANINLPGVNTAGNQNTTGTAANVTGTVAVANGGTGSTTAAGALTNLGAYAASNPSGYITTAGARSAVSFTAGSGAYNSTTGVFTIPTNTNQLTNGAGFVTSSGVTSVSGTGTVSGLTLSGTVTSTGSLTLGGNLSITADMIYNSFTATAAQTTFTTTNTYTSGKIDVFVNGVKMVNGSDVTVTSGTSVVMAAGLPVGTRVDLVYPI